MLLLRALSYSLVPLRDIVAAASAQLKGMLAGDPATIDGLGESTAPDFHTPPASSAQAPVTGQAFEHAGFMPKARLGANCATTFVFIPAIFCARQQVPRQPLM
jgi:hypothetical protein